MEDTGIANPCNLLIIYFLWISEFLVYHAFPHSRRGIHASFAVPYAKW